MSVEYHRLKRQREDIESRQSSELRLQTIEDFWRKVCERAEARNSRRAGRERFTSYHYAAAAEIIAEMRRQADSEVGR